MKATKKTHQRQKTKISENKKTEGDELPLIKSPKKRSNHVNHSKSRSSSGKMTNGVKKVKL
jgi:hypothetical protein